MAVVEVEIFGRDERCSLSAALTLLAAKQRERGASCVRRMVARGGEVLPRVVPALGADIPRGPDAVRQPRRRPATASPEGR
jgi:hypothetical protein